jgi:hypothetical protein
MRCLQTKPSRRLTNSRRHHGQAMLEYLWVCAVLVLALLIPWSGDSSPAQQLLEAIVDRIHVFIWWLAVI